MEQEICRRETTRKVTTIFKYLAWFFGVFAAFIFVSTLFVVTIDDGWEYLFKLDTSYIIPIVMAVIFAIIALIFSKIAGSYFITTSVVLTNKRIYNQIATSKINQTESFNLNAITYHNFYKTIAKGKAYFTLVFKTSTNTEKFIVDEEFYNEFVKAVNNAI